jgi:hypothetical protein
MSAYTITFNKNAADDAVEKAAEEVVQQLQQYAEKGITNPIIRFTLPTWGSWKVMDRFKDICKVRVKAERCSQLSDGTYSFTLECKFTKSFMEE